MFDLTLLLSLLAVCLSVYALIVARGLRRRVGKLDGEALYRRDQINDVRTEVAQKVETVARFVALSSQGSEFSEEQILEGRLYRDIGCLDAQPLVEAGEATVIDVREPHEYALRHIAGATSIPMSQLEDRCQEIPRTGTVIVHCASGARSQSACLFLSQERGFSNLLNLTEGIGGWAGATEEGIDSSK